MKQWGEVGSINHCEKRLPLKWRSFWERRHFPRIWFWDLRIRFWGLKIKLLKAHNFVWQGCFFFDDQLSSNWKTWPPYRPYVHDVISVERPHLEVKRRLFIGQYCVPRVQIRASPLFRHRFSSKTAAGWRQCIRSIACLPWISIVTSFIFVQ